MMYNWLVTSLAIGASIVIYDGSPFLPNFNTLWDLVDNIGYLVKKKIFKFNSLLNF